MNAVKVKALVNNMKRERPDLVAYILYKYAHIIKIFEIMKYLILKIINLKVKYFNNYIL